MNHFLALFAAYFLASAMMPAVIAAARSRNIFDLPDPRKIHEGAVPLLGGAGIFAALILVLTFFGAIYFEPRFLFVITSLLLLFFIGLLDDLHPMKPTIKLAGQFIAAFLVMAFADVRIRDWYGLFGWQEMSYGASMLVTSFVLVFSVNAYNFMDGMDGYAGSFAVLVSLLQGVLFYFDGQLFFALLSLALAGSVAGFLRFNLFPARVFMGDTGSMVIGWLLAISSVQLTTLRITGLTEISGTTATSLSISLMIIPVMDAFRVVFLRAWNGRSPFRPDNHHFHHDLLRFGISPQRAIAVTAVLQIVMFWMTITLLHLSFFELLTVQVVSVLAFLWLPARLVSVRRLLQQQG